MLNQFHYYPFGG